MAVTVICPACENKLPVSEELLGSKLRCKRCQEVFTAATNGVAKNGAATPAAKPAKTPAPLRKPAPVAASSKMPLYVGGGTALAIMAGLMIWALAFRGDGDKNSDQQQAAAPPVVPVIDLNSSPTMDNSSTPTKAATKAEVSAPATTQTSEPTRTKPKMAGFASSPESIPRELPRDILEKAKKSAVMIRITVDRGGAEGSGWFAEPGIIVTNAHVVNMVDAALPPPHSVRVFLYPGTSEEREVGAKILALDRDNDLCVLQVKGRNLPEPLPISPSSELHEGQQLHVMGFPLGSGLAAMIMGGSTDRAATTLKVRNTSVAGRVTYKNGGVKYVQIEGGADHGNSGGAIIDNAGHVRSVLVAGIPGTNLRFSIPSEYAVYLLQGRMLSVLPGQPYNSGSTVKLPVQAMVADPMQRIKKVALRVWAGDPGTRIRPGSDKSPSPVVGDSTPTETELAYDAGASIRLGESRMATGECDLPPLRDGQVYWVQPRYERIDGTTRWGEAVAAPFSGMPIDKKSASLSLKHESGREHWVQVESKFGQGAVPEGSTPQVQALALKVSLTEKTRQVEPDGNAKMQLKYTDFGFADSDMDEYIRDNMKDLVSAAKGMGIEYVMTNRGLVRSAKQDMTGVPQRFRGLLGGFNTQIIQSIESLALALPNKEVAAGETWDFNIPYTFVLGKDKDGKNTEENASYRLQFTYLGSRTRNGREEGIVSFAGRIVKGDGGNSVSPSASASGQGPGRVDEYAERQRGVFGLVNGSALVDLKTGLTTLAYEHSEVAIDFKVKGKVRLPDGREEEREITATFGALGETTLHRSFEKTIAKTQPENLLPEMRLLLNPFVGSPDPLLASKNTGGAGDGSTPGAGLTGTSSMQMPKEVLDRVKKQACLIRCRRDDGGGDGSGWLAEPGIVVTNAHVVGMVSRLARPPLSIEVFFEPATPNEKKFVAKILTIDHDNDLAVLQLPTTAGLPEPMPIVPSTDLYETQRLFVLGFPFGSRLGNTMSEGLDQLKTQLKIRDTSVAGRVENKKTGLLKYIQVEGGLISGNSGGAIVDTNGAVRCVAVAVIRDVDTGELGQMGLTIPSEYAQRLLNGYPLEIRQKLAYKDGSIAKQPIEMKFGDPLKKVAKVSIDYWVGKPGNPRRATAKAPKPKSDDGPRLSAECNYNAEKAVAEGDFVLPDVAPGYAIWVQPRYVDGTGNEKWGDAIVLENEGPPVERREVMLEARFKRNNIRWIDVATEADYRYVVYGQDVGRTSNLKATLREGVVGLDPYTKLQNVQYKFEEVAFGEPKTQSDVVRILLTLLRGPDLLLQIKNVVSQATYTKDGVMTRAVGDFSRVSPQYAPLFSQFNDQVLQSIQVMSIKFPNKMVEYGETWEQPTNLLLATRNRREAALFTMKMKYLGVRERGGRAEAIIEITGSVANDPNAKSEEVAAMTTGGDAAKDGDKAAGKRDKNAPVPTPKQTASKPLFGSVRGLAYIDVDTGTVAMCKLFVDLDVEIIHKDPQTKSEVPVRAGGTMQLKMVRRSSS